MADWNLQDARNRLSAVVDAALAVIAVEEYERLRQRQPDSIPTFVEHLLAIPRGGDLEFERWPPGPRRLDL